MSWILLALIGVGVVLIVVLLMVVVAQVKSSRHIENLKKEVEAAPDKKKPARSRPQKKAEPSEPLKEAPAAAATAEPAERPPEPVIPEPVVPEAEPVPAPEPEAVSEAPVPPAETPVEVVQEEEVPAEPTAYPEFNNARAVEQLGLSPEEADMFIAELVTQIEAELPNLESALAAQDCEKLEQISHMLKGSATSLGEGGVADVLVAFNTYCKEEGEMAVVRRHLDDLHFYFEKLKAKYAA